MRNIEVWMATFTDLREKQSLHAGAVSRARVDHEAAMRSGDIDLIMRSNETLKDCTARLTIITDLVEQHQATREAALAADRKARLAALVAEHQALRSEGVEALNRVLNALETFDAEVSRFASIVTKVQDSARLCNQLPAIRVSLHEHEQLSRLHEIKDRFFDAARRASTHQA